MKPLTRIAFAILGGCMLMAPALDAQTVTYADGDLLMGFHATGGAGANQTYVYNLGSAITYRDATSAFTLQQSLGADLAAIFGPDWFARKDLYWGVAGVRDNSPFGPVVAGDPSRTNYVSRAASGIGTSTPWSGFTSSSLSTSATRIKSFQDRFASQTATASSGNRGVVYGASLPNSWAEYNPQPGGAAFTIFAGGIEGALGSGTSQAYLDLYRILATTEGAAPGGPIGTGTREGTFSIDSNGTITFNVGAVAPAALLNISTRLRVGTDENVLIGGFIVTGNVPKRVIIRGMGPSLGAQNIAGALQDPTLELIQRNSSGEAVSLATNDDWRDTQEQEVQATTIPPSDNRESAIVMTLQPGAYTAIVRGKNATTGVGLVEVYDLDSAADAKLANISTRGLVQTGENVMIGGFIAGGSNGSVRVILRAIGPSLAQAGVANPLSDPTMELRDGSGTVIASNDNWKQTQQTEIEGTGVAPTNDAESAIVTNLVPGSYTAVVRGVNDSQGVGLIEVYRLVP